MSLKLRDVCILAVLRSGSGLLEHSGSFVTLVSPTGKDFTVVIEKMSWAGSASAWQVLNNYTTTAEPLTLQFASGMLVGKKLAVWKSVLHADNPSNKDMLLRQADVVISEKGTVTIDVCVDCLFTVTTMVDSGYKGSFPPTPPAKPFPLPHHDDFDHLAAVRTIYSANEHIQLLSLCLVTHSIVCLCGHMQGQEADFFQDQAGVWEAVPAPAPSSLSQESTVTGKGMAMRQMVVERPVCWSGDSAPISIIGSSNFT